MKLNKDDVRSLALAALSTFDSIDDFGISRETALKELREDIVSEFDDLNLENTMKIRLEHFKIKRSVANDYSERILTLDDERKIIYGIRHMNGNKDIPYLQICQTLE